MCISPNELICHGIPDDRPFEAGDIVNCDVTVYRGGYHGDCNATFYVGACDADSVRVVEAARNSLAAAIKQVRPGALYRDLGKTITRVATRARCSVVKSYCGHGINQLFHCAPNVPHYAKNKAVGAMKPGHIFSVEPMINLGTWQDRLWPDDWSAPTADGKRSAQFEHTLLVTANGVDVLTTTPDWDVVRDPPSEALDATGASRVKCPAHLAHHPAAVGVTVDTTE